MAGTLTISTLSDGTNSTSSTNCIQGSAKAWVRFNGVPATPTIYKAYNVSSITKAGTGQYTVNMTNALSDANYSVALSSSTDGSTAGFACVPFVANYISSNATTAPTTSSFVFSMIQPPSTMRDGTYISAAVFD